MWEKKESRNCHGSDFQEVSMIWYFVAITVGKGCSEKSAVATGWNDFENRSNR